MLFLLFFILSYLHTPYLLSLSLKIITHDSYQERGLYPDLSTTEHLGYSSDHYSQELEDTLGSLHPKPLLIKVRP